MSGREKLKKVLLLGYMFLNLGDDLFMQIVADSYPNYEFTCLIHPNGTYEQYQHNKKLKFILYDDEMVGKDSYCETHHQDAVCLKSIVSQFDQVVLLGGSVFIENNGWEITYNFYKKIAKYAKQFDILGVNFGPYRTQSFIDSYTSLFDAVNSICFRDRYSYQLFCKKDNVFFAPDTAFVLKFPRTKKDKILGISLINLEFRENLKEFGEDYQNIIRDYIFYFKKRNYKIRLFSFCELEGDFIACQKLKNSLPFSDVEIINYNGDINTFLLSFTECRYIIATRLHSMILGWLSHARVLPFAYSDKMVNIIKDYKIGGYYLDVRHLVFEHTYLKKLFSKYRDNKRICLEVQEQMRRIFENN